MLPVKINPVRICSHCPFLSIPIALTDRPTLLTILQSAAVTIPLASRITRPLQLIGMQAGAWRASYLARLDRDFSRTVGAIVQLPRWRWTLYEIPCLGHVSVAPGPLLDCRELLGEVFYFLADIGNLAVNFL